MIEVYGKQGIGKTTFAKQLSVKTGYQYYTPTTKWKQQIENYTGTPEQRKWIAEQIAKSKPESLSDFTIIEQRIQQPDNGNVKIFCYSNDRKPTSPLPIDNIVYDTTVPLSIKVNLDNIHWDSVLHQISMLTELPQLIFQNIDNAYMHFKTKLNRLKNGHTLNKTSNYTQVTGEIVNASFVVLDTHYFGDLPNYNLFLGELAWTFAGTGNLDAIRPYSKFWDLVIKQTNTDSSYGVALFGRGINQLQRVVDILKKDPYSRQAVISYLQTDRLTPTDIFCTISTQYLIRNNRLITIVNMRSNDIDRGFKYDMAYQLFISRVIANILEIESGDLHVNIGSIHQYTGRTANVNRPSNKTV